MFIVFSYIAWLSLLSRCQFFLFLSCSIYVFWSILSKALSRFIKQICKLYLNLYSFTYYLQKKNSIKRIYIFEYFIFIIIRCPYCCALQIFPVNAQNSRQTLYSERLNLFEAFISSALHNPWEKLFIPCLKSSDKASKCWFLKYSWENLVTFDVFSKIIRKIFIEVPGRLWKKLCDGFNRLRTSKRF